MLAGGVEVLGEAAGLEKGFALLLELAFEEEGGLVDGAEHGIGGKFRVGVLDKMGKAGKAGQAHGAGGRGAEVWHMILREAGAHDERFA